mmetsp:Transcript_39080/g.123225  ORF Transcript_39080/g.123225 Transcript_39080/m.123225 type:complete len:183 (-) Transcript_39080:72-620(-)
MRWRHRVDGVLYHIRNTKTFSQVENFFRGSFNNRSMVASIAALAVFGLLSIWLAWSSMSTRTRRTQILKPTQKLIDAASYGDVATLRKILKGGVSVNYRDRLGRTALMSAAEAGQDAVVAELLGKGADADIQDSSGWNAVMGAAGSGRVGCLRLLIGAVLSLLTPSMRHPTSCFPPSPLLTS